MMLEQIRRRNSSFGRRLFSLAPALLALLLLTIPVQGCLKKPSQRTQANPPLTADVAEMAEGGLEMPVTDFEWIYLYGGTHIKVTGLVRNNSGQAQQAVTLYVDVFDERGEHLGRASSFLTPTYLPPGADGAFEITVMPMRNKKVSNLRLVTSARMLR